MNPDIFSRWAAVDAPLHGGAPIPEGMTDFSISINPFPLPDSVRKAFNSSWDDISVYPDTENTQLKQALSACFNISESNILAVNGSTEAFSLLASALLGPGKRAMVLKPCYSDYEHVSRLSGADVYAYSPGAEAGFKPESQAFLNEIKRIRPDLLWLCSPCNPSGIILDPVLIKNTAEALDDWGGFTVVDEAYSAFAGDTASGTDFSAYSNLIRVRSLTKDFGVPGLRLGYLSGRAELIRGINLYKPCWSVSRPAQKAGLALLREIDYYRGCWDKTMLLHDELITGLRGAGADPLAVSENLCGAFVFFRPPSSVIPDDFYRGLFKRGIKLRDCASMGAAGHFRAGVKLKADNISLVNAVRDILSVQGEYYER